MTRMCQDNPELREKAACLSRVFGGWERWFQLELAYYILTHYWGNYEVKLEDGSAYPGSGCRADISIHRGRPSREDTFVELKCQTRNESPHVFVDHIVSDIAKMKQSRSGWDCQLLAFTQTRGDTQAVEAELIARGKRYERHETGLATPDAFFSFFYSPYLV